MVVGWTEHVSPPPPKKCFTLWMWVQLPHNIPRRKLDLWSESYIKTTTTTKKMCSLVEKKIESALGNREILVIPCWNLITYFLKYTCGNKKVLCNGISFSTRFLGHTVHVCIHIPRHFLQVFAMQIIPLQIFALQRYVYNCANMEDKGDKQ